MDIPILQNDRRLASEPSLAPFGCFAVTLREIAEHHARKALGPEGVLEWYSWCVEEGKIADEPGRRAFVIDHAAVINAALYYLDKPQTARYVGALYIDEPERSWGAIRDGNYWAGQAIFEGFKHSHFYESDVKGYKVWDSYWPHGQMGRIISVRAFKL